MGAFSHSLDERTAVESQIKGLYLTSWCRHQNTVLGSKSFIRRTQCHQDALWQYGFLSAYKIVLYKISTKANIQMVNRGEGSCTSNLHAKTSLPVPSVARHALSHWLWYDIILVGQMECFSSECFSGGCLSMTQTVHLANGFATNKSKPVDAYPESHYAIILMKAATQRRLHPLDLCSFGLDMKGGILVLAISHAPAGPDALIDAITCGCVAQGKACCTQYGFYHHHIRCMVVCNSA